MDRVPRWCSSYLLSILISRPLSLLMANPLSAVLNCIEDVPLSISMPSMLDIPTPWSCSSLCISLNFPFSGVICLLWKTTSYLFQIKAELLFNLKCYERSQSVQTYNWLDISFAILNANGSRSRQNTLHSGAACKILFVCPPAPKVISINT